MDLDKALDNLEEAKQTSGRRPTPTSYRAEANYRFSCPDCEYVAFRKQARGQVKKVVEDPSTGRCPECGHVGIEVKNI